MRIGIDIRSLQTHDRFRGIGAYVRNLVAGFARLEPLQQYQFFLWPFQNPLETMGFPHYFKYGVVQLHRPARKQMLETIRKHFHPDIMISRADADAFLQPNALHGLPGGDVPTVTVVYDLIPLIFRDQYSPLVPRLLWNQPQEFLRRAVNRWDYTWQLRQIVASDRVIAISQATKRDLLRFFPKIDPAKITVTHLAADPIFHPAPLPPEALVRLGITKPFLIYTGGIDFRKNIAALLHAYEEIRKAGYDVQLVLVGQGFDEDTLGKFPITRRRLMTSPFHADIVRTGFVTTADLVALYSSAVTMVFPSLYEGFGLPIVEAMACGCPVIAYRTSSIPEVAGSAGLLLDESDDLAGAIERIIRDPVLRANASADGLQQAARFSWTTTAKATLQVLQQASTTR